MLTSNASHGLFATGYVRRMSVFCFGASAVMNGKSSVEFCALPQKTQLNIPHRFINPRYVLIARL